MTRVEAPESGPLTAAEDLDTHVGNGGNPSLREAGSEAEAVAVSGMSIAPSRPTRAGVGRSESADSRAAAAEAARAALAQAGVDACDLAIVFATHRHDPDAVLDGVRSVIGPRPRLVGGVSFGTIVEDQLGWLGYDVGVAVIASDTMKIDAFLEPGLDARGERAVGAALARQIAAAAFEEPLSLLLMLEQCKPAGGAVYAVTWVLEGMADVLGQFPAWPSFAGIAFMGDLGFTPSHQWFDDRVATQSALALALHGGGVRMDTVIMHGCKPSSSYHTVTKADGQTVLELDGRPALEVLAELIPDKQWEEYPLFVTLGMNRGDKFGEFREEEYANRASIAVDLERGGLVMIEPDLVEGTEVQLMRRSVDMAYVADRVAELFARVEGRRPFLALYIDCAARAGAMCHSDGEDATIVHQAIAGRVPLFGMYSGSEMARVGRGHIQALDWTGVLCLFSEPAAGDA